MSIYIYIYISWERRKTETGTRRTNEINLWFTCFASVLSAFLVCFGIVSFSVEFFFLIYFHPASSAFRWLSPICITQCNWNHRIYDGHRCRHTWAWQRNSSERGRERTSRRIFPPNNVAFGERERESECIFGSWSRRSTRFVSGKNICSTKRRWSNNATDKYVPFAQCSTIDKMVVISCSAHTHASHTTHTQRTVNTQSVHGKLIHQLKLGMIDKLAWN